MKIKYIKIIDSEGKEHIYKFTDNTMIYSEENSKGKTTLIRLILYGLGYQIPATEGIGSFDKYKIEISIYNSKDYIICRKADVVQLTCDKKTYSYKLPEQENDLHSILFKIDNITILNNLLAVYYIDQEKGWTLLNRGKIIGNIRFNIEEFIAGISNKDIDNLLSKKKVLNNEIKKYRYFKNVIDINSEFEDDEEYKYYDKYNMNDLFQAQKELELEIKETKSKRKKLEKVIRTNDGFAEMIENYGIIVNYKNEEFILTKDKLSDFTRNQDILKIKLNNFIVEEGKLTKQLAKVVQSINEKNSLFEIDDLIDSMQHSIEKIGIDVNQIDKILKQLTNKRTVLNKQIKDRLSFNNIQLNEFFDIIVKYAKELGIFKYISNPTPQFVLTNKLKGLSGRVLAQMSYIFKLSYIKAIEKNYNVILPIIIDSPRTNELSEESTNDMLTILKRDFQNHQIIVASIYRSKIIDFNIINLNNGLMS